MPTWDAQVTKLEWHVLKIKNGIVCEREEIRALSDFEGPKSSFRVISRHD